jgi:hypothetical protein
LPSQASNIPTDRAIDTGFAASLPANFTLRNSSNANVTPNGGTYQIRSFLTGTEQRTQT